VPSGSALGGIEISGRFWNGILFISAFAGMVYPVLLKCYARTKPGKNMCGIAVFLMMNTGEWNASLFAYLALVFCTFDVCSRFVT